MTCSGVGLHSGNRVTMSFLPAPPNSGIRFRRVDLEGKPEIEARIENVVENNRSTTLAKGNTRIHTVEHVLAAVSGLGITNCIIELKGTEPPEPADGSVRPFVDLLDEAGDMVSHGWIQGGWFTVATARGEAVVMAYDVGLTEKHPVTGACLVGAVVHAGGGPDAAESQLVQRTLALTWHAVRAEACRAERDALAPAH